WCRSVFEALEQIDQSDIMQLHRSIPSLLESLEGAADVELFMENVREIHPASYDLLYDITERSSDNSDFLENLYEQLQVLDPSIITAEDDSNDDLDSAADNTEYADDEDSMDEDETENILTRHPWPQSFN